MRLRAAHDRRGRDAQDGPSPPAPTRSPAGSLREVAAVFVGGFIGAVARAALADLGGADAGAWPWATFGVNLTGAFLLGYLVTRLQERLPLSSYRRPFVGTGVCGALTTFSTMQLELLEMLDAGRVALAGGYALASAVGGFAAVALATNLVRRASLTR